MSNKKRSSTKRTKAIRRLDETTPFAIRESFNQLRTNIMYTPNDEEGCPVYGITSAEMGVGKSTVSSNLAISFSQIGKKVLLIDADMRRPSQHKFFDYEKKQAGLSELLTGIAQNDSAVICTPREGINVITSGCIPPNPSELLLSKKFGEYMSEWKQRYDIIFIDLPPVGIVSDPLTIAQKLNGYIFIAMANVSDSHHVNKAINSIQQVGGKITGLVVNASSRKSEGRRTYGYKYGYRYGYRYSYNYGYYSHDDN